MNKKLLLCLAASLFLTFALSFALVGCSEELPSAESTGNGSKEERVDASSQETSSEESSEASSDEPSSEAPSNESSAESLEGPSEEPSAEPSEGPSEPEESSEEPVEPSEPDESSEEPVESSEPDESSEEPAESSEPDESSEEPVEPSEPDESSEEPVEPSEPDESSEEPVEPSEPEENVPDGSGTEEDPYLYIPLENTPVTTLKIQPGVTSFYGISRVGGMDLTIESNDVFVIYEGVTYTPVDGVLTLRVERELASTFVIFEIGNSGTAEQSFDLLFASPLGSMGNAEVKETMTEDTVVSLEAGNEIGYFYRYTATQEGTIRFYLSATVDSFIRVTNNRSYAQMSSDGVETVDEQGRIYFDISVQAGDELSINMGAVPNRRGKYPATVITWSAEYV